MTMKAIAKSPAPPMPWTARKTMSCVMPSPRRGSGPNSPASPHSAEPERKMPMAQSSMVRRLITSASLP